MFEISMMLICFQCEREVNSNFIQLWSNLYGICFETLLNFPCDFADLDVLNPLNL